ncbi:hypothetical protein CC77DRAFT_1031364 [Alternaria alternata]|uniref:Mid2 domain-containing protein n=3 Tax=Alternaria alternata complex TaxID=187734 RepID=A0A177DJY6_ALTAL|nr:hypothetical protein CC77DRAFT_1031364 [Alternaria alternata]KAH6862157.1 hypothetical protein B0T12DRAFT_90449 [Alternaria alternata]OAG20103.1 hypothetical protein CC77DRAFT_1031364 [Alternaria alternata]RYO18926.1 hypothetical protein AA0121_g4805 [Alternaria tenuissima]
MVSSRSLLTVFATFIAVAASQKCYAVDGTALDSTYTPCNPSAKHSSCCASTDVCMSNGLCMGTTNESIGMIFSRGCTDSKGKDASCQQICPGVSDDSNGLKPVKAWQLQTCDSGEYCCRGADDTKSCCDNAKAPKVTTTFSATLQLQTPTATNPVAEVVATAVSTGTPFEATTTPTAHACAKEKRETAIVGGTIAGVFSMLIAGLSATVYWMYKREKRQRKLKEHYEEQFSQTNAYRKALASSAGSCRGSVLLDELKLKSSASE